ncbi:hypothetical protein LguiB_019779 [Lonicera macranthoides]
MHLLSLSLSSLPVTSLHFLHRCISTIFDVLLPRYHTPSFKQHRSPDEDSSYKLAVSKPQISNFQEGALNEKIEILGTNATIVTFSHIDCLAWFLNRLSQRIRPLRMQK